MTRQPLLRIGRIERHNDGARREHPQKPHHHLRRPLEPEPHPLARHPPGYGAAGAPAAAPCRQLPVGESAPSLATAIASGRSAATSANRAHNGSRWPAPSPPLFHPSTLLALRRAQQRQLGDGDVRRRPPNPAAASRAGRQRARSSCRRRDRSSSDTKAADRSAGLSERQAQIEFGDLVHQLEGNQTQPRQLLPVVSIVRPRRSATRASPGTAAYGTGSAPARGPRPAFRTADPDARRRRAPRGAPAPAAR